MSGWHEPNGSDRFCGAKIKACYRKVSGIPSTIARSALDGANGADSSAGHARAGPEPPPSFSS